MTVDGHHEPLVSMELWEEVQARIVEQKRKYGKYARKCQPIEFMLKGLVRCSACGATLVANGISGKAKTRCLQCHNYAKGSCHTPHGIVLPKLEEAFFRGIEQALGQKQFKIVPNEKKKIEPNAIDYDKLIALEQRRLERAKEAYLAEIDSLEQYAKNKATITAKIEDLKALKESTPAPTIDTSAYARRVAEIVEYIKRDDVDAKAKNEALRTIIEKIVYDKPRQTLEIYFHE